MGFSNTCLACSKECSLQCSDCRVVHFCNRECQKSAWKHHKAFCKSVTNPAVSSHHKNTDDNDDQRQTCVIIDGFGPCGANWDDTIKSREQLLLCGMDVIYINGMKRWFNLTRSSGIVITPIIIIEVTTTKCHVILGIWFRW